MATITKYQDIREYANRRWHELRGGDCAYWAAEYQRSGFITAQKVSLALWRYMKTVRNGWPDAKDRQRDLDDHIKLKLLLDRNADAISSGRAVQRS